VPESNPLLDASGLPRFDRIEPAHVEPAMGTLLADLEGEIERLESGHEPSWAGLVEPLERIGDRLAFSWGIVGHLMGVKNGDPLREAHEACQPDVVKLSMRLGQSVPLYRGLEALRTGDAWDGLDAAQHRIVETLLRDARLSGVALQGEAKERFNEVQLELAELSTRFSNHVLDATKAFALVLHDADEVDGLPRSLLELAAQSAREAGEADASADSGPWRITLDYPSFVPFLEHCRRRDLREQLYRAYVCRASSDELDNTPVLERTLELRREAAKLLGYETYAEVSLASKMAPDVEAVERLLEELRRVSVDAARHELAELAEFARGRGESAELAHWDVAFWAERLREERYAYSEEELRPYFPLPVVLEGLFGLAQRLFGVEIRAADGEVPVWHEDVRFFRVYAEGGEIAAFYLDPYSRPAEKRGGAWMDECVGRTRVDGSLRLPVAYLVCNGTPPVDGRASLMTFQEAETLFHEFGHGLQHMLTAVDYGLASGIRNVEWDAVELPSQFMENWLYQRETVRSASGHVETRQPLPDDLFDKISAARTYRAGSAMLRQLYFAFTDLELHHRYASGGAETAFDVQRRIAAKTTVIPPLPEDRFLCSFAHIFAGGYAAGYYSYKWAEVLSADAFAAFEEAGLDDEAALTDTGRRYRDTVLALGGSAPPMDVFKAFRGREPRTDALLRHSGLEAAM
jgi:oligopeptidase A